MILIPVSLAAIGGTTSVCHPPTGVALLRRRHRPTDDHSSRRCSKSRSELYEVDDDKDEFNNDLESRIEGFIDKASTRESVEVMPRKKTTKKPSKGKAEAPHVDLGIFAKRAITVERAVKLKELTHTDIPAIVGHLHIQNLIEREGKANVNLVREFFGSIQKPTDTENLILKTKLRGKDVVFSADCISKFLDIQRPTHDDKTQYPYLPGVDLPNEAQIVDDLYIEGVIPQDKYHVKFLKPDVAVLHLILWYNLDPRGVKSTFDHERALMLYAVHNFSPLDVPKIIWQVVDSVAKANNPHAALPFGLLVTDMLLGLCVPTRPDDEWKGQMSHIGRGTYGKTQGQSRKHRERQDPTSLESISTRLYEAVSMLNRMELQHKKDMRKVKLELKKMRKAFCGEDFENSTSSNDSEQESNGSNHDDSQQMDTDNDG
ncbi:unnamed protein product [Camellia sinensis]